MGGSYQANYLCICFPLKFPHKADTYKGISVVYRIKEVILRRIKYEILKLYFIFFGHTKIQFSTKIWVDPCSTPCRRWYSIHSARFLPSSLTQSKSERLYLNVLGSPWRYLQIVSRISPPLCNARFTSRRSLGKGKRKIDVMIFANILRTFCLRNFIFRAVMQFARQYISFEKRCQTILV